MTLKQPIPQFSSDARSWAYRLTSYLQSLEDVISTPSPKIVQLEHKLLEAKATINGLMMYDAGLGVPVFSKDGQWFPIGLAATAKARVSSPVAGSDIGAAYQDLTQIDTAIITSPHVTLNLTTGVFNINLVGLYEIILIFSIDHNQLNAGRVTNVRVFNKTDNVAVAGPLRVAVGRDVTASGGSTPIVERIDAAKLGKDFVFQVGGGDNISSVVWVTQTITINRIGN